MAASEQLAHDAQDRLERWIDLDQRVVSYRELAREFGININLAKNLLTQHYRANEQALFPTYLMTGRYLPSIKSLDLTPMPSATQVNGSVNGEFKADAMDVDTQVQGHSEETSPKGVVNEAGGASAAVNGDPLVDEQIETRGMLLVGGRDEMEAKKQLFVQETLHVQIHSLSAFRITDPAVYLSSTVRLRAVPGYNNAATYGTITGEFELLKGKAETKPSKPATTTSKAPSAKSVSSASVFSKPAAASKTTPSASESNKAKGKAKATGQDDDEPMLKPGKLPSRNSKRVIRSESPQEEEATPKPKQVKVETVAVSMPNNTSTKPLNDLHIADEDRLAMEAMMDMSDNFDAPSSSAMVQPMDEDQDEAGAARSNKRASAAQTAEQAAEVPEGRTAQDATLGTEGKVLKKRRVTKSVEKINKRGFAYFEDVSTDEEYWSDGTSGAGTATEKSTAGKANALKRNASTTSVSTRGEDDADSAGGDSPASGVRNAGSARTKAGAAVTSGTRSAGAGKTSAAGSKPASAKKAGQTSMLSFFKKQ
ncbi:hypothetical protein NliqN6_2699 [Naganishia liquefaciens]|uniref:DNA polymerase delta subunit 3 n=1 Tax=Naganishia liquefaciens TaxID=104408 RepID=A0A8H3TSB3_9TREE|nr:hypothetical protein NliqN6_2699 [Naganishia liquefaciens]